MKRSAVEWPDPEGDLRAYEPTPEEVAAAAPALAAFYNDAHNRTMMAHEDDMSVADVLDHYQRLWDEGGRPFLLERGGVLMGDADLRCVSARTAEFAIMVGSRAAQGKGVGTRFAIMVHELAFETLGLERIYVSIVPANAASRRLFEKLGYELDASPEARGYADEDEDVTMSVGRARFADVHAGVRGGIRVHAYAPH